MQKICLKIRIFFGMLMLSQNHSEFTRISMKKKISFAVVFNIIVIVLSIGLIAYFCVSEDGLIDLISSDISLNILPQHSPRIRRMQRRRPSAGWSHSPQLPVNCWSVSP